jgi:phosphotransferase system IIA component
VKNKDKLGLIEGMKTIDKMGCKVKTGSVVWNQHKQIITNEKTDKTIQLIMTTNLKSEKLERKKYMKINNETEKYVQKG